MIRFKRNNQTNNMKKLILLLLFIPLISFGQKIEVIKDHPYLGSIHERVGGQDYNYINGNEVSKESILYSHIRGEKPTGSYEVKVEAFQIKVGIFPTRTVRGYKVQNSDEAIRDINRANRGSSVKITVLEAVKIDGDFQSPIYIEPFIVTIK